jgi:predicted flap endonuclease-1-like 5' DNA nuclease
MSSSFFSILAQTDTGTGSDWNWLLIFIIFVVILVIALVIQARFSTQEAEELTEEIHHEEEVHHAEAEPELAPAAVVAEQPEPEAETPDPEAQTEPDDLKQIEGIGPKVADLLNENGITTFALLADASVEKLTEILEAAQLQMMDPASWPQQAKLAAAGEWEALGKMQDELKGGR